MQNIKPMLQLIDISEAAKMLRVSMDTLRRWDKLGKLKSIRLTKDSRRKYKIEDIEDFIEKGNGK